MNLFWLYFYVLSFFNTVVVGCLQPVNWSNCWPPHEWLLPALSDYARARKPYSEEFKILKSLDKANETQTVIKKPVNP